MMRQVLQNGEEQTGNDPEEAKQAIYYFDVWQLPVEVVLTPHPLPPAPMRTRDRSTSARLSFVSVATPPGTGALFTELVATSAPAAPTVATRATSPTLWGGRRRSGIALDSLPGRGKRVTTIGSIL